ncbi:uncharacterized protein LOC144445426 [Glandiceps talaboti]
MSHVRPSTANGAERQTVRKVVRSPALMKKRASKSVPLGERVTLERVLGLTVSNNATFDCDPNTGLIAYTAGCVIVLFNPRKNKQTHIFNHSRKTITAVAFSSDGKHVVTGESGHLPAVRVWDVQDKTQVIEFAGHKFGISCVAFSPNLKYVVSVGSEHDMVVNVWEWRTGNRAASNKISCKVTAISFSEDGNSFVTSGTRNVRFWYMSSKKSREAVPLHGRSGILGEQRNNFFCDVACGKGANKEKTFCITKSGLLCEFDDKRLLDKWVELRTTEAYCITVSESSIFVGCANGTVRIFSADTLHYIGSLPRPHFLGVNVAASMDPSHLVSTRDNAIYPDTVAITLDDKNNRLTAVYNDHSFYVWDVRDIKKIGKSWSFLYHSAPVWGVEFYPNIPDGNKSLLPPDSFITCSSDNTIRVWNMDSSSSNDSNIKRNIFSNELLNIIYVDGDCSSLCEDKDSAFSGTDKADPTSSEDKKGVRCLCISPNGQQLAAGDRSGNVHIYDFHFNDEILKIEAHDAEVLCLEYSKPESGSKLLASASRDRLIHIFNIQEDFSLLQTLDDHSSSITSVKFTGQNDELHMISCGADKSIMFRTATRGPDRQFLRNHHVNGKTTLYDMALDAAKKNVVVACQDRNLRIYNIRSGKQKKAYKGSLSDDGTLIRVEVDPSGVYAATSCSDKTLSVYDFYAGECVATMFGHSELVTGLKFSPDLKHVVSVSGDGCIFVWKLPIMFTQNMKERLAEMGTAQKQQPAHSRLSSRRGTYTAVPRVIHTKQTSDAGSGLTTIDGSVNPLDELLGGRFGPARESLLQPTTYQESGRTLEKQRVNVGTAEAPDYRFSVGQLPSWAKKQVSGEQVASPHTYSSPSQPRGRWAQRVDDRGFKVKSEWEDNGAIQLRLAECMDRRRLTVEPDALSEQETRMDSILGRKKKEGDSTVLDDEDEVEYDSLDDDDEFLPAAVRLQKLEEEEASEEDVKDTVRRSRGSISSSLAERPKDLGLGKVLVPSDSLDSPSTPDREIAEEFMKMESMEDESEDKDEDTDDKEVIIYPPTTEEDDANSDSPRYCVNDSMSTVKKYAQKWRKMSASANLDRKFSIDSTESDKTGTESPSHDNSEEDDEEMVDTPTEEQAKDGAADDDEDDKKETEFLKHNYESLSEAPGQEKFDNNLDTLEVAGKEYMQQIQSGRLSISTRFLTRSQQNHLRNLALSNAGGGGGGIIRPEDVLEGTLKKRQEEMAKAVDDTRKRLEELGYKDVRRKSSIIEKPNIVIETAKDDNDSNEETKPNEGKTVRIQEPAVSTKHEQLAEKDLKSASSDGVLNGNEQGTGNKATFAIGDAPKMRETVTKQQSSSSLSSQSSDASSENGQPKARIPRTLPSPTKTISMVKTECVTLEKNDSMSSGSDGTGKYFESKSENNSPVHTGTIRSRARSQEGLERITTTRSRSARRARTERHLPALPTGKSSNYTANTSSEAVLVITTTTTTTSRPRKSLYAQTESSLAKKAQLIETSTKSTSSPRRGRVRSHASLDLPSPENEDVDPPKLSKEAEDRLAMPPPQAAAITKTKTASRRSMSDPRQRTYSKARRFQPNTPKKEADRRSQTINDPTTVSKFVEDRRNEESMKKGIKLQPSIDEEEKKVDEKENSQSELMNSKDNIRERNERKQDPPSTTAFKEDREDRDFYSGEAEKEEVRNWERRSTFSGGELLLTREEKVITKEEIEDSDLSPVEKEDEVESEISDVTLVMERELERQDNVSDEETITESVAVEPDISTADSQLSEESSAAEQGASSLTMDECCKTAEELQTAFSKAVDMHSQVLNQGVAEEEKQQMLSLLSTTFNRMQETLSSIEPWQTEQTNKESTMEAFSSTDLTKLETTLALTKTTSNNNHVATETSSALTLLDHYSDMLVTLVKKKIVRKITQET